MGKTNETKSSKQAKLPSKHSNIEVTWQNAIVECLFYNIAKKNKTKLPPQFWRLPEYKKQYTYQLVLASKLIKSYQPIVIIAALNDSKAWRITSLAAKFVLPDLLKKYQKRYDDEQKVALSTKKEIVSNKIEAPRAPLPNKSLKSILD